MLLTLIETEGDGLSGGSAEALAVARGLATDLGVPVEAVTFAAAEDVKDDLAKHGVSRLHTVEHDDCADYSPERWGEALAQFLKHAAPEGAVAASTDRGNELMAQAAARAGLPLAANCVAVRAGDPWTLTRQRGGGMLLEDAELSAPIKLVTTGPGAAEAGASAEPVDGVSTSTFTPVFDEALPHSTIIDRTTRESGVSLATAAVVVSGGRGVGSAEGFATLDRLAELVGGAVGCSRVVTNSGWRPHSDQVGLTGTKVAPELYIACGISGASQHWVGCMDAKRILAINLDAEAPMVTRSSYAVIGDVQEVLSAVIDELNKREEAAA